jgi:hypothetical protein
VHGGVVQTEHLSHFIAEYGVSISRPGRHIILSWCCPKIADNRHRAKPPENQTNITLSGQNSQLINGFSGAPRRRNGRDAQCPIRGFARRGAPCEPRDGAAYSPDNRPCGPLLGCAGAHPGRWAAYSTLYLLTKRKAIDWTDSAGRVRALGTYEKTTFRADSSRQLGRRSSIGQRPRWTCLPRAI